MLRNFGEVPYVPILAVRPAEMRALQELPNSDKNSMFPLICLRPWLGALEFNSVLERVDEAYGNRPWIADIDATYFRNPETNLRPVHNKFDKLRDPSNGYANWCEFIDETEFAVPCIQYADDSDTLNEGQINTLQELDKGLVLRVRRPVFGSINNFLGSLNGVPGEELLIVLDFGRIGNDILIDAAQGAGFVDSISEHLNGVPTVVAGTSFPSGFAGIAQQEIFERQLFNQVRAASGEALLIYGDYGSARAERLAGGGAPIIPRIDYPLSDRWMFERWDDENGFQLAAKALMRSDNWDENLQIWGTQRIEATALGDQHAIISPARATAARINIHLHRQTWFGGPEGALYETEDDWED